MADESHVVRGVNWRETFPFTQIFRAFRVAIHPTKLILALVALIIIYAGGWVLDSLWPVQSRAIPQIIDEGKVVQRAEIVEFANFDGARGKYDDFESWRKARRSEMEDHYAAALLANKVEADSTEARKVAQSGGDLGKVKSKTLENRDQAVKNLAKQTEEIKKAATEAYNKNGKDLVGEKQAQALRDRDKAIKAADDSYRANVRQAYSDAVASYDQAAAIKGEGVFNQFFDYEKGQLNNVSRAVLANDWLGGFSGNPSLRGAPGVLQSISNFCVTGPWWMARVHTTYFILFLILFSLVWAIFGGAICRIAAVHVARDEKLSLSVALRFSTSKFLSFIFAPIIPLIIVLVVGLVVTVGGLIGNIPFLGPILMGIFFFLALAAGFVMTLVLFGTGGGFNLMYPTIAVEGSDSFDAISRSFSYVYARPWRMLFYTLIAVLYGALCYLFVRYFLVIMLFLTHRFVGVGMFTNVDGSTVPIDVWNTMWPSPGSGQLTYDINTMTLGPVQTFASFLVSIWVYLTVGMLGAFAISFYFSANTIIYYLMRREVDATELDDVYVEQSDEDFGDTAGTAAVPPAPAPAAPAETAASAPAADAPPATPPPAG